ncbi:hypothetical protein [Streptomyces sennicomposti]|uniref:hypothetical protein n=1 Tax=Streptomyces sennicomposti TaxID=2873384 RepID=UPI001CA6CB1A|nr:hypothetical protein [Streptomyces sennicomposti]MBY8870095.1 hypothetical protein [Streptomyces sennicomposti]
MGTKTAAETTTDQEGTGPTGSALTENTTDGGEATATETATATGSDAAPAATATEKATGEPADSGETASAGATDEVADSEEDPTDAADPAGDGKPAPSGVGQGAGAVVAAALGVVSLSGGWLGTVAAAREQLIGQLRTPTSASVATQIKEVYGDAWHTTALWAGVFALVAMVVGVVVLARPAFGAPRAPQAPWIKSVAWAGVVLGVIGLLLAVLKYTDALLGLPSTS